MTPTARTRPAKVSALADFLIAELTDARRSAEVVMGWNHRHNGENAHKPAELLRFIC